MHCMTFYFGGTTFQNLASHRWFLAEVDFLVFESYLFYYKQMSIEMCHVVKENGNERRDLKKLYYIQNELHPESFH